MHKTDGNIHKVTTGFLVYDKTGEIINELYEGDRILRNETIDYLKSRDSIDAEFAKLYLKSADMLSRNMEIKEMELRVCLRLLPYIRYDTGLIAHVNGEPISRNGIKGIFPDMGDRTIERALDDLCEQDVYIKATRKNRREVYFIVNPYIFMRGAKVNKTLLNLFSKSDWASLYKSDRKQEVQ